MNHTGSVIQIPIEDIIPNRFQPRIAFDEKALQDLANSIKQHGIIQPLVVRRLGDKYEIIAGERRYKASQLAGLISVPAVLTDIDDQTSAEVALVENVQRKDLTAIEEARSYKNILDKGSMTQEELAKKMGVSQSAIANKLRLLNLADEVQDALLEGKISERHARSLLMASNHRRQVELLNRTIEDRLTVRQLDTIIKSESAQSADDILEDVPLVNIEQDLEELKSKATDINPVNQDIVLPNLESMGDNETQESNSNVEQKPKFFNFLDNSPKSSEVNSSLLNFSEPTPDDLIGSLNNFGTTTSIENMITSPIMEEEIETLDDDISIFNIEQPKERNSLTEKINKVRNLINEINMDDTIKLEEIDLDGSYQINITIDKN
ncbi:MAG: ParB/RepB/Spo0J family partition protein [Bacilli bacterium]|nr:ParB/RepB/Spo0J family partition protein [Bacilli bacterium]